MAESVLEKLFAVRAAFPAPARRARAGLRRSQGHGLGCPLAKPSRPILPFICCRCRRLDPPPRPASSSSSTQLRPPPPTPSAPTHAARAPRPTPAPPRSVSPRRSRRRSRSIPDPPVFSGLGKKRSIYFLETLDVFFYFISLVFLGLVI